MTLVLFSDDFNSLPPHCLSGELFACQKARILGLEVHFRYWFVMVLSSHCALILQNPEVT